MTSAYLQALEKFESGEDHVQEDFYGNPIQDFIDGIEAPVKNTINNIENKLKTTVNTVIGGVKNEFNAVKDDFNGIKDKIVGGVKRLESKAEEVAKKALQGAEEFVSSELDDIGNSKYVQKTIVKIKQPIHDATYVIPIIGLGTGGFCVRFFPGVDFIDGYLEKNTTWYVRGLFSLLIVMVITLVFVALGFRLWRWSSTDPKETITPASYLGHTVIAPITLATKLVKT